jgi:hypothetical protein
MKLTNFILALFIVATFLAGFCDGGPITGFITFSACIVSCGSVGAIAFAGAMAASGIAAPAVGYGAIACCTDLCSLVSAAGLIAPLP